MSERPWIKKPIRPNDDSQKPKTKKQDGRFETINHFCDLEARKLTPSEFGIWVQLWRDTRSNGTAQASQNDLAKRMGLSKRQVVTILSKLESKGFLETVKKGNNLTHESNVYRLKAKGS